VVSLARLLRLAAAAAVLPQALALTVLRLRR
jgi:hypothetical protein